MKILIIAKIYHSKQSARAIQMRRVISALLKYTNHNFILITEGNEKWNKKDDKIQILNVSREIFQFPIFEKIFDRLICSPYCLKENKFIFSSTQIAIDLISKNEVDLLLTVSTSFDSHIAGLNIKNKNPNLKWITFFSDLWPTSILPKPYYRKKILSNIENQVLKSILTKTDCIISPSEYALEVLKTNYSLNVKYIPIQHCSDEHHIEFIDSLKGYIVHSGFLTRERILSDLIQAISELQTDFPKFKGLIQIGPFDSSLKELIRKYKCKSIFTLGHLPEDLSKLIQQMNEISIIIEAPMKETSPFMPSKITDSLILNKKLICITPNDSFLSDFAKLNEGIFTCQYNKNDIKRCIKETILSTKVIQPNTLEYFHPKNIAQKYDNVFQHENF